MPAEIRLSHRYSDNHETPEGEDDNVWAYRKQIQEQCRLPDKPPHSLSAEIADEIRFIKHDIAVLLPEHFTRDDAFSLFLTHENPMGSYYRVGRYREIEYDYERAASAMRSTPYLPHYWDVKGEDLMASYGRSLNAAKTLRAGYVDYPSRDCATVQLGIRRTPKPDPALTVEGLYYHQFLADEWHWDHASPQLFAAIEKNLEGKHTIDPFEWVRERATIASGYSVLGGGKDCSPLFLAGVYERMASITCNTPPVGHDQLIEYEVGEEERELLTEVYGRYAATVSPEMVKIVLEHGHVLTPEILRSSATIKEFCTHLLEMLENGLNVDRIDEFTRASTTEKGTLLQRLESAMRLALKIYRGQKPWWFKEDFSMDEWFLEEGEEARDGRLNLRNDRAGRETLERIAERSGFAFRHVLEPYHSVGYRLAAIAPFTESDAIDFTVFVTEHYGIGNTHRAIEVLRHCFYVLQHEEETKRPERLKNLREHLDDVQPQTAVIGRLEARNPVFEMPGINALAATVLSRNLAETGEIMDLRIGFDTLTQIDRKFAEPIALRARTYAPALPSHLQNMERRGLLVGQSPEARLALPMPEGHLAEMTTQNAALGLFDFYAQLKAECGEVDRRTAIVYFHFCAARMPDPWHPPKGFLKFLELFREIETPGWRFSAMEHPKDRPRVEEENQRREIAKQMLVSNMLDAWIMGLLTAEELEALFSWLTAKIKPKDQHEIEKDVMHDWREQLAAIDAPRSSVSNSALDEWERKELQRSPEERMKDAEEQIQTEVQQATASRTNKMRTSRMVDLQQTFTMLSVLNSMSIAGSFSHEELRSVLRETILPQAIRGTDNDEAPGQRIRSGQMLTNLVRLQELGGIDHEALREAVQGSGSPEEACQRAEEFIQQVLLRCMEESVSGSLPRAVERVTTVMKQCARAEPSVAERELNNAVSTARRDLEVELRQIWDSAPFATDDIVERLMRSFRIPQYAELFGPIQRFNLLNLPRHLPASSQNPRHKDLPDSNAHSARMFYFIGSRILQEQHRSESSDALEAMRERHGASSHVDMSGGTKLATALTEYREGDSDPSDLQNRLADLAGRLPDFQKHVDAWRLADVPLGPIGGRWHFGNPMSDKHMELFTHLMSLGQTPFRMIHANTSLIIPGFMSKNEMRMFIYMLALEGLIDPTKPELQIGITGRLNPELSAYFGSSCMLGTAECAPFKIDSFVPDSRNHNLTAARIVAYDAYPESDGTRRNFELPFMSNGDPCSRENVAGRTDILGRWNVRWNIGNAKPDLYTMDDLDIAHTVGAVLRHVQEGGPLKEAGLAYMARHREVLEQYGISDTLNAPWVYTRESEAYQDSSKNPEHFERCVKACMDVHFENAPSFASQSGAIFDVRKNIDMLMRQVENVMCNSSLTL